MSELKRAWSNRESRGVFERTQAVRIFHGPGESKGDLKSFAVDRFGEHYWITQWEGKASHSSALHQIVEFLKTKEARSAVVLSRPEQGAPEEPIAVLGNPPSEPFKVEEGDLKFWIQVQKTRHPGLFLDHAPLRRWLVENMRGLRVLNTFAYTGSLSVASAVGGAKHVTTLDLSKPTVEWAKQNAALNSSPKTEQRWIAGDVFEWLPRLRRDEERFDCLILDPPSFSRGKKGQFSTARDLERLHSLALDLLADEGILITSINSANLSWKKFETDLLSAMRSRKKEFSVLSQIDLPDTFPTPFGQSSLRYLKGWILQMRK